MDPSFSPQPETKIIELLAGIGGLSVTGVLGYLVVRRARRRRRQQIEDAGEAPRPESKPSPRRRTRQSLH